MVSVAWQWTGRQIGKTVSGEVNRELTFSLQVGSRERENKNGHGIKLTPHGMPSPKWQTS